MNKLNKAHILLALVLLFSIINKPVVAQKPATDKPSYVKEVNKIVRQSIKYPEFSLTKEEFGSIYVTFSLTDDGTIKIEKITGPSKRIVDYVTEKLTETNCKDIIHPYNQMFKLKFRFENS